MKLATLGFVSLQAAKRENFLMTYRLKRRVGAKRLKIGVPEAVEQLDRLRAIEAYLRRRRKR